LRFNLWIWNPCNLSFLSLPNILPPLDSGQYHNQLSRVIDHQVHMNAITCLSVCGHSHFGVSHQEMSKQI
jgi:hypothetical protein